jgi:PAS domain S-box-containing protein
MFVPAVLASAWYGGMRWGLMATASSSAFMIYFVLEPAHSFKIDANEDVARIFAFLFVGAAISFGVAFQRRIRDISLENAERLRTTLESIGDAVTVTDINGNITMMNAVSERLTGWPACDAIGKPLRAVFHVVDEENRKDVFEHGDSGRNPFVIHLPERSVLVSCKGSECPIEASVGLIKEAERVFGTVVVFRDVRMQRQRQQEMEETARRLGEIARVREQLLSREQAARDEAVAANRMKDEFLAMVSHELRTPLTSIIGWSTIMRAKRVAPETLHTAQATIERNATLQLQLVEDLLDVSRITAGTFRLERRPVDIDEILTAVIDGLRVALDEKQIALDFHMQTCPTMSLDPSRLQQVFWNLLSNAIKFTPPNGHIDVDLNSDGRTLELQVADDGRGFDPDFQPRLFQRFQQADRKAGKQGLGLGLAITRHIVEMHGGTISGQSRGVDKGATFIVRLPLLADIALPEQSIGTAKTA